MVELTRLSKVKLTPDSYANKIGNTIVLSRSFNAQIPLFYVAFEDCLWYCDNYPSLVRAIISANIPLSLNKSYIYDQLKFQTPLTSETLFHPIRFLRVGEMHHVDSKSGELIKTEFSDRSSSKPLTSREFSDFLQQQLSNIEEKDAVFHISSGLDSSLLAIMHSKLGHNRVRLASCKTRGNGASNELENVERLAKDISAELNIYDLTDIDIFSMGKQLIAYQGYPVAHPSNLLEYALDSYILNDGASTIINGKGPDDCLAGYVSHQDMYSDRFTHLNRLTVTSDSILTELFGGAYGNATNYWENSKQPLSLRERINYDARAITDSWNHIHHSFAKGFNCEILSPFMDPVIRSGLFALPDEERINNGKQKAFFL